MSKKSISFCFVILSLLHNFLFAESIANLNVLKEYPSAKVSALGGSFVGQADDVNALFINPSGMAFIPFREMSALYIKGVLDISQYYLAYIDPVSVKEGGFGVGFSYFDGGKADIYYPDGTIKTINASREYLIQAGFGKNTGEKFSFGGNIKYIGAELAEKYKSNAFALDFGIFYKSINEIFSAGLAALNIGTKINYSDVQENLPLNIKGGLMYKIFDTLTHSIKLSGEVQYSSPKTYPLFGIEYNYLNSFFVRTGYSGKNNGEVTVGFGVGLKGNSFNYSFNNIGVSERIQKISFDTKFVNPTLLKKAGEYYSKGYYKRAEYVCNQIPENNKDYAEANKILTLCSSKTKEKDIQLAMKEVKKTTYIRGEETTPAIIEAQNKKVPRIWALIVGINYYKDKRFGTLKYAKNDALLFYEFLKGKNTGSVPDDRIIFLSNERATRSEIIKAMNVFLLSRAAEDDLVIIYMAQHGLPDPATKQLYFIPYECDRDNISGTAIKQYDIMDSIKSSKVKKIVLFLDACHSGGFAQDQLLAYNFRGDYAAEVNSLPEEISKAKPGIAIVSATSSLEYSQEDYKWGEGHGVFTYYLVEGLKGKADKIESANHDNIVQLRELYDYLYDNISKDTLKSEYKQHPSISGSGDDNLPLAIVK